MAKIRKKEAFKKVSYKEMQKCHKLSDFEEKLTEKEDLNTS